VKTFLGLTDTTYDAQITAMIPVAEAKYREVAAYGFNSYFDGNWDSGESIISVGGFDMSHTTDTNSQIYLLQFGDILEGDGIPNETYITALNKTTGTISISNDTTDSGVDLYVTTNIAYRPVISEMIWYLIGRQDTSVIDTQAVKSKSVSPLSVTYADNEINSTYGLPQKIVDAIPKYAGMY